MQIKSNGNVISIKNSEVVKGTWSINFENHNAGDFFCI